jgi:transcriptional regulator with XRE-family HTH domain
MSFRERSRREPPAGGRNGMKKKAKRSRHTSSRAETLKRVRGILGRTQEELAVALGVSAKAIQSYEQGWRNVPVRVVVQLLVLLALHEKRSADDLPCWKVRKCSQAARAECPSYTMTEGRFCWFVAADQCRPKRYNVKKDVLPCMECPVIRRLLGRAEKRRAR